MKRAVVKYELCMCLDLLDGDRQKDTTFAARSSFMMTDQRALPDRPEGG